MTGVAMQETVGAKIDGGTRLSREEGRWLLTEAPLLELGQLADTVRRRLRPGGEVTFVKIGRAHV